MSTPHKIIYRDGWLSNPAGVNIIKLRISVLREFSLFFRKTENESFYLRNLAYEKTEKNYESMEKNMKIQKNVRKMGIQSFIIMKNTKTDKFSVFTILQKFYNIDFFENMGKISVIQKYEKTKFYNI